MPLSTALLAADRLVKDAEKRGDRRGAKAWEVAVAAILAAEQTMRDARLAQTWRGDEPDTTMKIPRGVVLTKL